MSPAAQTELERATREHVRRFLGSVLGVPKDIVDRDPARAAGMYAWWNRVGLGDDLAEFAARLAVHLLPSERQSAVERLRDLLADPEAEPALGRATAETVVEVADRLERITRWCEEAAR